jgi:UDP-N-acetylglucosamine--N-acetylmuramyl-(pentapeptide) pyrophosphoryl-undecaprenol N-acetylglucosamine transferase
VRWLGTQRGLESEVVPKAGIDISYISIAGLRGKGALSWLTAPFKLAYAMLQSMQVLMKLRPVAVLGMGGFVTGPAGLMSFLMRYPLVVHEQNAIAGMTNRWLAKMARRVLQAFPETFERSDVITTGNPIRSDIMNLPAPEQRFAERGDSPLRLLVLGGSLGARALNDVVPQALALLDESERPEVWHQAGKRNIEEARQAYQQAGVTGRVDAYVDDMAEAYGWADIVLCRAGALTIAELACAGVGAILVPFPYAVDDHQTRNGAYLADSGAALLIQQNALTAERLASQLKAVQTPAQGRAHLLNMARAARALAKPEATNAVAQQCLEVAYAS